MHRRLWVKNSVAVQQFAAPARLAILVRIGRYHFMSKVQHSFYSGFHIIEQLTIGCSNFEHPI
jgi:hypothetical protein